MTDMIRIDNKYEFEKADQKAETYFSGPFLQDPIREYHVKNLPGFVQMLKERFGGEYSEKEILEIAKTTFRNKPEDKPYCDNIERQEVVDFTYEF